MTFVMRVYRRRTRHVALQGKENVNMSRMTDVIRVVFIWAGRGASSNDYKVEYSSCVSPCYVNGPLTF